MTSSICCGSDVMAMAIPPADDIGTSNPEPDSGDDLIQRAKTGDSEALAELYRKYDPMLVNLCRGKVRRQSRNGETGSDVAGDTWLYVCKHIREFRGKTEEDFVRWLRDFARRKAIPDVRRQSAHVPASLDDSGGTGHSPAEKLAAKDSTPSQDVRRREEQMQASQALKEAMAKLSPDQRIVIEMRNLQGRKIDDIAIHLGYPREQVIKLLASGKKALSRLLKRLEEGQVDAKD